MQLRRSRTLIAAFAVCGIAQCALAAPLPASLVACSKEIEPVKRLSCYDSEVKRVMEPAHPKQPEETRAAATDQYGASAEATDAHTLEDRFGVTGELKRQREEQGKAAPELHRLSAHIAKISHSARDTLIIELDNGQIWEQSQEGAAPSLGPGDAVTIRTGALGSYWLDSRAARSIRVHRNR